MIRIQIIFFFIILFGYQVCAQEFTMSRSAGGMSYDVGTHIVADDFGNIYAVGFFGGLGIFGSNHVTGNGCFDIYVAKYNSKGENEWVNNFGGWMCDYSGGLCIDSELSVYVGGEVSAETFITDTILQADNNGDAIIVKYDTDGNMEWVNLLGGSGVAEITDMKFAKSKHIYVCGTFRDTLVIGNNLLYAAPEDDMFLAKLNTDGKIIWAKAAGGYLRDLASGIAIDDEENIYMTGLIQKTALFGKYKIKTTGGEDLFISKYDSSGKVIWGLSLGGYGNEGVGSIDVDQYGNSYITGAIAGNVTIENQIFFGNKEFMLAKFDKDGKFQWLRQIEGHTQSGALTVDKFGSSYVVGKFDDTVFLHIDTLFGGDAIFARYSTDGQLRWVRQNSTGNLSPYDICFDGDGLLYITGRFDGNTVLGSDTLKMISAPDIFITALSLGLPLSSNELPQTAMPEIFLYPNPNEGIFKIIYPIKEGITILLYNMLGVRVWSKDFISGQDIVINLPSSIENGVYMLLIKGEKLFGSRKVVIRRNY